MFRTQQPVMHPHTLRLLTQLGLPQPVNQTLLDYQRRALYSIFLADRRGTESCCNTAVAAGLFGVLIAFTGKHNNFFCSSEFITVAWPVLISCFKLKIPRIAESS